MDSVERPIAIALGQDERTSGLLRVPSRARACYVLAHGAGAGMNHPFLESVAAGLAERDIATLRFQFRSWSAAPGGPTRLASRRPP
jgi:predicted alpha/beta-hydrolase family hydrolase